MKKLILLAGLLLAAIGARAQSSVQLTWSYIQPGSTPLYIDGPDGTPLDGAGTSANGDGFVLQLGYYSLGNLMNPFQGVWIPVFGPGGSSSLFATASMGDNTGDTGTDIRFTFTGTVTGTSGYPPNTQVMVIRYYNATSVGAASYYGAATDVSGSAAWTWKSPSGQAPPPMSFSLKDPGVSFEGGVDKPETNVLIPVPEPAALWMLGGGLVLVLGARRNGTSAPGNAASRDAAEVRDLRRRG